MIIAIKSNLISLNKVFAKNKPIFSIQVAYFVSNVITSGYLFYLVPDQNQVEAFSYGFVVI